MYLILFKGTKYTFDFLNNNLISTSRIAMFNVLTYMSLICFTKLCEYKTKIKRVDSVGSIN